MRRNLVIRRVKYNLCCENNDAVNSVYRIGKYIGIKVLEPIIALQKKTTCCKQIRFFFFFKRIV